MFDAVADYHRRADGRACVDYAFHLIVSDPSPTVLQEELPTLIERGYTSFKLYMTYEDMKLDELKEVAARYGVDASAMRKKADVIAAIEAAKAEQPDDGTDDEEPPQIGAADPV